MTAQKNGEAPMTTVDVLDIIQERDRYRTVVRWLAGWDAPPNDNPDVQAFFMDGVKKAKEALGAREG